MGKLAFLDSAIIVIYLGAMLLLGLYANRKQQGIEDYYVAGRKLNSFTIAALWLSSWVGGASIIGASEKAYSIGLSAVWFVGSIAIGLIIFGVSFPPLIKRLGDSLRNLTYPDLIEARYGPVARIAATVTTILAYIAYTASQFSAMGVILYALTGWSMEINFLVAAVVTISYTALGGYLAVTYTDMAQALLLLVGVVIVGIPVSLDLMRDAGASFRDLPDSFLSLGNWDWLSLAALSLSTIFSFFTSMDSYTRCYAAKDERSAQRGTLLALVGVVAIAAASTVFGLVSKTLMPDIAGGSNSLAELILRFFPTGIKGLVLVGIIAAIMDTGDICILTASANVTRDIYQRFLKPQASEKHLVRLGMFASVGIGVLSLALAWYMDDIINILLLAFTINSAGLFLPTVVGLFWKRASAKAAVGSMVSALIIVMIWFILGEAGAGGIFALDPLWPGFIGSAIVFFAISLLDNQSLQEQESFRSFQEKTRSAG